MRPKRETKIQTEALINIKSPNLNPTARDLLLIWGGSSRGRHRSAVWQENALSRDWWERDLFFSPRRCRREISLGWRRDVRACFLVRVAVTVADNKKLFSFQFSASKRSFFTSRPSSPGGPTVVGRKVSIAGRLWCWPTSSWGRESLTESLSSWSGWRAPTWSSHLESHHNFRPPRTWRNLGPPRFPTTPRAHEDTYWRRWGNLEQVWFWFSF